MATGQVTVPARLSDPQLFALAVIRERGEVGRWEVSNQPTADDPREVVGEIESHSLDASVLQSAIREEFPELADATVPRALQRLDERGLVTRVAGRPSSYSIVSPDDSAGRHLALVLLTREGERVAREISRRHGDGRYSLAFETLD